MLVSTQTNLLKNIYIPTVFVIAAVGGGGKSSFIISQHFSYHFLPYEAEG